MLGRYQIVRELSEGAMGTVFEAVDPLIERTVAIKTIKLDFSKDELADFEQRFLREAKSAGRLNHPNIVTIYDVGEANDVAYLAMEYLEGETLREVLDSGVALSVGKAAWIAGQIAEALCYAEEHGVVHRDVKPANIIITRRGQVKLTDFGIAVLPMGSRTQSGMVMGSPKYMSPEQAMGYTVDSRSDIFSLGVVLFEMLTGKPPFDGDNLNAILYRVMNEEPADCRSLNPRIPQGVANIVAKMLEKKPERRYENARSLARDLKMFQTFSGAAETAANGEMTVDAGAATLVAAPRAVRGGQANMWYAGSAAAAIAVTAGWFWLAGEERAPPPVTTASSASTSASERGGKIERARQATATSPARTTASVPQPREPEPLAREPETPVAPPQAQIAAPAIEGKDVVVEAVHPERLPATMVNTVETERLPAAKRVAAPAHATLSFAVAPWGEIYVDSKKVGVSPPMNEFRIPAGRHKVEIRNSHFVPYSKIVVVEAHSTKEIRHKFQ